jgi:arylsulfatase A-like enzyme
MPSTILQKNWPWLVAAGLILLWLASTAVRFEDSSVDDRPVGGEAEILQLAERDDVNVLFILIDTLRAERLGAYGYHRDTSPAIDEFASKGVRFARQLSQSTWTKASMASLWTGLYPVHTGVTRFDHVVSDEAVMPAEVFRDAGFKTIGIYRNGWVAPTFGFNQGFDVYTHAPRLRVKSKVRARNPTISNDSNDEETVAAAIEFLRVSGHDGRWLLYLHFMDVHEFLYDEESALFGGAHSDMYDNSIRWTDGTLKILFSYLREFGLADNTIVAIASDHGEAFRERGLEGHARAVYRETTEVPFLLAFPFKLEPGVVVPTRTQNIDIWPTIFDLIGIDPPAGLDGVSRVPEILTAVAGETIEADDDEPAIAILDETWGRQKLPPRLRVAVSEGPYRYVRREAAPNGNSTPTEELFDAASDPKELEDVLENRPEVADRLRRIAADQLEEAPTWGEAPKREIGELELNQLRALGYALP